MNWSHDRSELDRRMLLTEHVVENIAEKLKTGNIHMNKSKNENQIQTNLIQRIETLSNEMTSIRESNREICDKIISNEIDKGKNADIRELRDRLVSVEQLGGKYFDISKISQKLEEEMKMYTYIHTYIHIYY